MNSIKTLCYDMLLDIIEVAEKKKVDPSSFIKGSMNIQEEKQDQNESSVEENKRNHRSPSQLRRN